MLGLKLNYVCKRGLKKQGEFTQGNQISREPGSILDVSIVSIS